MENASKALIIAGAILISILLIGVGVMVMNGAQGGIDEAIQSMSAQEKDMFNTKFTQYEGTKIKGYSFSIAKPVPLPVQFPPDPWNWENDRNGSAKHL